MFHFDDTRDLESLILIRIMPMELCAINCALIFDRVGRVGEGIYRVYHMLYYDTDEVCVLIIAIRG